VIGTPAYEPDDSGNVNVELAQELLAKCQDRRLDPDLPQWNYLTRTAAYRMLQSVIAV
jgi:hypothetical protein